MTEDDQSPPPDRRVYVLRLEAASIHQLRAALKTLLPRRALPRGKRGDRAGRPPATEEGQHEEDGERAHSAGARRPCADGG
jgi:hypothetical protein